MTYYSHDILYAEDLIAGGRNAQDIIWMAAKMGFLKDLMDFAQFCLLEYIGTSLEAFDLVDDLIKVRQGQLEATSPDFQDDVFKIVKRIIAFALSLGTSQDVINKRFLVAFGRRAQRP
jgi:hypothetical protein